MQSWHKEDFVTLQYLPRIILPQNEVEFWSRVEPGDNYDDARVARGKVEQELHRLWNNFYNQDVSNKLTGNAFGPKFKRALVETREAFKNLKKVLHIDDSQALRYSNIILQNHGLLFHVNEKFKPQLADIPHNDFRLSLRLG